MMPENAAEDAQKKKNRRIAAGTPYVHMSDATQLPFQMPYAEHDTPCAGSAVRFPELS